MHINVSHNPKIVGWSVIVFAALFIFTIVDGAWSQTQKSKAQKQETFTRPAPTRPIKPEIPSVNRYQSGKVFLEEADSLYTTPDMGRERQILMGNVKFRQGGMFMYCDSAYYYPEHNSMDAFGNVRMVQGDTLRGFADVVYYDGDSKLARMRTRGSGKVKLENRSVILTTDSLDYSIMQELGWYNYGGKIEDGVNVLTSTVGRYSPSTKIAEFEDNVLLVNKKDGYTLTTSQLLYNTATHIASIDRPTTIAGATDTIYTTKGMYNTVSDNARLESRSIIHHRDSSMNLITLEGDSIIYDKRKRVSEAYMFRDPLKDSHPMVITDTARHAILIGGYGYYNDSLRYSFATDYPLLKEFSQKDTLFLRADTIEGRVKVKKVPVGDVALKNETRQFATAPKTFYSKVEALSDTLDTIKYEDKEFYDAKAFRRARFFRQDVQGVADSLHFDQLDSVLHMVRKPVVWSGERQVVGNLINVHFNDSTADWVELPDFGILSEHVADEFYNQLSGKKLFATFTNGELDRLEVDGNVQTIFLPSEKDSTYNKLISAESSFMTADMSARTLDKLKMWPEVSGKATPLFMINKNDIYLPAFQKLEEIRPRRAWYGDEIKWEDDLGDIPDALELYFGNTAPANIRYNRQE